MRQRRSRTPSASTTPTTPSNVASPTPPEITVTQSVTSSHTSNVLPDLLPKTFHLAESSSLFSRISEGEDVFVSSNDHSHAKIDRSSAEQQREQAFSVVEIRESNLTSPKKAAINRIGSIRPDQLLIPKTGEVVNTVTVLEIADYFEPECVETVNILDVTSETSDTETSTTPIMDDRKSQLTTSQEGFDEMVELLVDDSPVLLRRTSDTLHVETIRASFDENKRRLSQDRDLLHDSELDHQNDEKTAPRNEVTSNLKEILSGTEGENHKNVSQKIIRAELHFQPSDRLAVRSNDENTVFILFHRKFFLFTQKNDRFVFS